MTKTLIVEPEALAELEAGVDWYEHESPGSGVALATEAEARVNALAEPSGVSGLTVPGVRKGLPVWRVFLEHFPYAVIYVETDEAIHVVAFAHLKKRPLYWRRRLQPVLGAAPPKRR
jgi:plasmid stabilization system protein ParE